MSKKSESLAAREAMAATLRRRLRVGSTVYVTQHHVSRSGMSRDLSLSVKRGGGYVDITREAAIVLGSSVDFHDSDGGQPTIKVGGCGMDMHFHIVYSLARSIRPNGHICNGEVTGSRRCPSNDHSNDWGRLSREYSELEREHTDSSDYCASRADWMAEQSTHGKNRRHSDGGYTLKHSSRWID